jgi:hypothetical protein
MKKRIVIFVLCMITILSACLAGCININIGNTVRGNGDKVTREKTFESELKGVSTSSMIDVILDPELEGKCILEGDSNLLDLVKAEQYGGVLELGFQNNINILPPVNVTVYVPFMDGGTIEASSVGSVSMKSGTLTGDSFRISVSSAGSIDLDIETKELRANGSSTGSITLTGSADRADITLSSVGSFNGYGLAVGDARVNVSSVGSAYVNVSGRLDATVSSVGSVVYDGDPEEVRTSGDSLGAVKPR